MSKLFAKTVKSSVWNVIGFVVTAVILFIATPLLIKYLGTSMFGIMALLISILIPLGVTNFGMGRATVKYVAEFLEAGDQQRAEEYLQVTFFASIVGGLVGVLVLLGFVPWLVTRVFNIAAADIEITLRALYLVAGIWLCNQVSAPLQGLIMALHRYDILSVYRVVGYASKMIVGVTVLHYGGNLFHFFMVLLSVGILETCVLYVVARMLAPALHIVPRWHRRSFGKSFNYGIWDAAARAGALLFNHGGKYMLGILLNTTAVAIYEVALSIEQRVITLAWKMGETLFPSFSRISAQDDLKRTVSIFIRASWLLGCIGAPLLVTIGIVGRDFLYLWVGKEIGEQGGVILLIVCVAGLISISSQPVLYFLMGYGHTRLIAFMTIMVGVLTIAASYIFITYFGLIGAAIAVLVTIGLTRPLVHFFMWRRFFKRECSGARYCIALSAPVLLGIAGMSIGVWFKSEIEWVISGWLSLIISSIVLVLFFLAMIILVSQYVLRLEFVLTDIRTIYGMFRGKVSNDRYSVSEEASS